MYHCLPYSMESLKIQVVLVFEPLQNFCSCQRLIRVNQNFANTNIHALLNSSALKFSQLSIDVCSHERYAHTRVVLHYCVDICARPDTMAAFPQSATTVQPCPLPVTAGGDPQPRANYTASISRNGTTSS